MDLQLDLLKTIKEMTTTAIERCESTDDVVLVLKKALNDIIDMSVKCNADERTAELFFGKSYNEYRKEKLDDLKELMESMGITKYLCDDGDSTQDNTTTAKKKFKN